MKKRTWITAVIVLLLLAVLSVYSIPQLRIGLFVHSYHEFIEESLAAGNGVPADDAVFLDYHTVNRWEGAHPMTEFLILSWGDTYYGCYYSPDDVPLAFQNSEAELLQKGHDYWAWSADGDNYGFTSKIMECWYFFQASF